MFARARVIVCDLVCDLVCVCVIVSVRVSVDVSMRAGVGTVFASQEQRALRSINHTQCR